MNLTLNIFTTLSARVVTLGLALVSSIVLARWLGPPLLAAFVAEVLVVVWRGFPASSTAPAAPINGGAAPIGALLFRDYVLPFEVTSILVLVAVLGAVVLAKKEF